MVKKKGYGKLRDFLLIILSLWGVCVCVGGDAKYISFFFFAFFFGGGLRNGEILKISSNILLICPVRQMKWPLLTFFIVRTHFVRVSRDKMKKNHVHKNFLWDLTWAFSSSCYAFCFWKKAYHLMHTYWGCLGVAKCPRLMRRKFFRFCLRFVRFGTF